MAITKNTHPKWKLIRTILCALLIVFGTSVLTACDEDDAEDSMVVFQGSDSGDQALKQKQVGKSCWTCPLFELGFDTADSKARSIVNSTAASAVSLIGVGFGLWLVIRVLKLVGSMKEVDSGAFWKDMAVRSFWLAMCAALLKNIGYVVGIIDAIFIGFVDFGLLVVSSMPIDGGAISCPTGTPKGGMLCLITAIQEKLNYGMDFAWLGILFGRVGTIFVAFGMWLVSIIMMLYFPILLIDTIFRYALILALTPIAVAAYCLPVTRNFSKKALDALIEVGMQVVGMSVFVAMSAGVMHKYIHGHEAAEGICKQAIANPLLLINDSKMIDKCFDGSVGVTGFVFISFFLILFGGVLMEVMKKFGAGLGSSGDVNGAFMLLKNGANQAKKVGNFAHNRKNRAKDKKAQKTYEDAKKNGTTNSKEAKKAQERLKDRGYLRENKDTGKLDETKAYQDMQKGGLRQGMKNISDDFSRSSTGQRLDREEAGMNPSTE